MQLEFHQLDGDGTPASRRRTGSGAGASLAESGQQTPIVVVLSPDTATAIWSSTATSASRRSSNWPRHGGSGGLADGRGRGSATGPFAALFEHETALEQGWLLAEMEQRFGYGLDELARRLTAA